MPQRRVARQSLSSIALGLKGLFGERQFGVLLASRLTSQAADGLFQASLYGALLFNPDHRTRPAQVALGLVLLVLPYSIVGPFTGVFLDRWRRQRVLARGALLHGGFAAATALLLATAGSRSIFFDLAAFAAFAVNRFYLAAQSASLPRILPDHQLVTGNAFTTTAGTVTTIAGAGIGLGVRHLAGAGDHGNSVVAAVAFLGYLAAAAVAARIPGERLGPDGLPDVPLATALRAVPRDFVEGGGHLLHHRPAAFALAALFGQRALFGVWTIMTLLLYRNTFTPDGVLRAGLVGAGQAATAGGVGLVLAALVTPRVARRTGLRRWIVVTTTLPAVGALVLGTPFSLPLYVASAVVLGFGMQGTKICVDTTVQESVDDEFRGRAFAIYDAGSNVCFAGAAVVGALVLPLSGRSRPALVVMSALYLLLAAAFAAATTTSSPTLRGRQRR
ncbi:MAG TPA: MFS transporter [Mycobacteriales bacterium]|nr:MFS transporter [Mycobacteriales bacterium]